jgi:hypothetical protein
MMAKNADSRYWMRPGEMHTDKETKMKFSRIVAVALTNGFDDRNHTEQGRHSSR